MGIVKKVATALLAAMAASAFTGSVYAHDTHVGQLEAPGVDAGDTGLGRSNAIIGLGVGISPDYEGSDVYEYGLVLFGRFSYREYQQYLQFSPNPGSRTYQARLNVLPYEGVEMGPMLDYRRGRKHVGNKAVRSLPNIDNGAEVGGFLRYWLPLALARQGIALDLSGAADVTGAYDGWWIPAGSKLSRRRHRDGEH